MFSSVDLPQPEGPSRQVKLFSASSRSTPRSAVVPGGKAFGHAFDDDLGRHAAHRAAGLRQRSSQVSSRRSPALNTNPITPITAAPSSICDTRKKVAHR